MLVIASVSCFVAAMRLHSMLKTQTTFTMGAPQQGGATWGAAAVPIVRSGSKEKERDTLQIYCFKSSDINMTLHLFRWMWCSQKSDLSFRNNRPPSLKGHKWTCVISIFSTWTRNRNVLTLICGLSYVQQLAYFLVYFRDSSWLLSPTSSWILRGYLNKRLQLAISQIALLKQTI